MQPNQTKRHKGRSVSLCNMNPVMENQSTGNARASVHQLLVTPIIPLMTGILNGML